MMIRVLDPAEEEIEAARLYLNAQSARLGERFIDDLRETLSEISDRPEGYPKLETLPDDCPYRRAILSVFRYAVIFEILAIEILVVAVVHTSREPNYWLLR